MTDFSERLVIKADCWFEKNNERTQPIGNEDSFAVVLMFEIRYLLIVLNIASEQSPCQIGFN